MIALSRILLPTDFSESSLAASGYALECARQFGAVLHLLHVIEDPIVYLPMFESYPLPSRQQFETYAEERLENWIPDDERGDCRLEFDWRHGSPFHQIVGYARESGIDLIVMGTHGRGFTRHLLMGNVAEKVIRSAPCPVMTIRPEGHRYAAP